MTTEIAGPLEVRSTDGLGAYLGTIQKPAQRWDGSKHSAARAIAAALKLLQAEDPTDSAPNLGDLVSICSELVFRATGERIRPAVDSATAHLETSIIVWHDCSVFMPEEDEVVLIRSAENDVFVASHGGNYSGWSSMYCMGDRPFRTYDTIEKKNGRKIVREEVVTDVPIVAWAHFPNAQNASA